MKLISLIGTVILGILLLELVFSKQDKYSCTKDKFFYIILVIFIINLIFLLI